MTDLIRAQNRAMNRTQYASNNYVKPRNNTEAQPVEEISDAEYRDIALNQTPAPAPVTAPQNPDFPTEREIFAGTGYNEEVTVQKTVTVTRKALNTPAPAPAPAPTPAQNANTANNATETAPAIPPMTDKEFIAIAWFLIKILALVFVVAAGYGLALKAIENPVEAIIAIIGAGAVAYSLSTFLPEKGDKQ